MWKMKRPARQGTKMCNTACGRQAADADGWRTAAYANCARQHDGNCFPHASPTYRHGPGKRGRPRWSASEPLKTFGEFGAGEGIRTLDPNLGKGARYTRRSTTGFLMAAKAM